MLSQAIWWSSIALETLLLIRGFQGKLAFRYPVFYSYVAFVLFEDFSSFVIYRWNPRVYSYSYWATEFLGVVIGCGVVFEIYRMGLLRYPGTARMARNLLILIFVVASVKALTAAAADPRWWSQSSTLEIEQTLRAVQAILMVALVALFLFYSIPFGTNLRGILLGYGLFIGVRVICLTFVSAAGRGFWFYAYSASYLVVLSIWLAHLWSYREMPDSEPPTGRLENDYQRVAAATRRRLQAARRQLVKAGRS
jgi:hypothetical protein